MRACWSSVPSLQASVSTFGGRGLAGFFAAAGGLPFAGAWPAELPAPAANAAPSNTAPMVFKVPGTPSSISHDAGGADDLAPFFVFGLDVGTEFLWRAGPDLEPLREQELLDVGLVERLDDFDVEPVDDRARRLHGGHYAVPVVSLESLQPRLRDGRKIGQHYRALEGRDREAADLAVLDLRHRGRRR